MKKNLQRSNGKPRNWSPIFGDPLQSEKKRLYTPTAENRDFKAFVYRAKQSGSYNCPTGWSLGNQKLSSFFNNMGNLEVSAFDIITSSY